MNRKSRQRLLVHETQNEVLNSMMDLITGVIEYAKASSVDFNEELIDLNLILEEIQKLAYFPPAFKFKIPENMPDIYGNKTKILQVFLNLVNNAEKYN